MPARALIEELPARLAAAGHTASAYAQLLREGQAELKTRFEAEESIESLVHARAQLVDAVLREIWRERLPGHDADWALVAVGGYGRGELQPCSDVDILTLVPAPLDEAGRAALERFVTFLWDVGIEIGHSVRTIDECRSEAAGDVSIMTTLIEARRLAGSAPLVEAMLEALAPAHLWPVKSFFEAKVREQADRHAKANDTAYNLEPNVKTGPGGLRDIQTIAWVAKRHFGAETLEELATQGFLTVGEARRLQAAQAFLWKVRFALHTLTGRREDRLLFDHQMKLARLFGYEDATFTLAVEQFMQRYYRTVLDVSLLNELLLQLFREAILDESAAPQPLNPRFQLTNGYLEALHDDIFVRQPSTLLEVFALLQQNPDIRGVRAHTIRAIVHLAALFHDIAKGRGGDHSELGSVDAESFCLEQGLSRYDARLVAWLVRNHLQLSLTAQKQDISDPKVINEFARFVGDETHLDYLYVLTAADVRATNPRLWNSWKASLFSEFHERVKRALRRGLETPVDQEELKQENQTQARELLAATGVDEESVDLVWGMLSDAYFLRHTPQEIAWHTRVLAERDIDADDPVVSVQAESERGTTSIMTFAPHRQHGFARTTAVLDQLGFNIVDARITPTGDGNSIDLYHVLEEDGTPIADAERHEEIELALRRSLAAPRDSAMGVSRRAPRQVRLFNTRTQIVVTTDERNHRSVLEIIAADRPGLLCDIGKVMMDERIDLLGAKIMTVGERAEDVFYVSDSQQGPLADERAQRLVTRLTDALDQRRAA
ncbi:MAG: HD domain-containing protein [Gammaproteobacteria bacterium]|nr:HD domain-containing protein [Gammaproteobacteria bacterium]